MEFIRNRSIKEALNVGLISKIPDLMKKSHLDSSDWYDVLNWAILSKNIDIWKLMISLNNKNYKGKTIDIIENIHDLLWTTVTERDPLVNDFIIEILKISNLFKQIELDLKQQHIHVVYDQKYLCRENRKIYFGLKLYIDKCLEFNHNRGAKALEDYYYKYKK